MNENTTSKRVSEIWKQIEALAAEMHSLHDTDTLTGEHIHTHAYR